MSAALLAGLLKSAGVALPARAIALAVAAAVGVGAAVLPFHVK